MSFSIITVNYNNSVGLAKTIDSVKELKKVTNAKVQFIIIDGGSTDTSITLVEGNSDVVDTFVSESDEGIFHAMNKGIELSCNDWLIFMNSGDTFYSSSVLSRVLKSNFPSKTKVIIGSKVDSHKIVPPYPTYFIKLGIIPGCHQSMLFKRKDMLMYNLKYKIYGDFDLIARIYKLSPESIFITSHIISEFEGGGVSSFVSRQKRKDKYLSLLHVFGIKYVLSAFIYRLLLKMIS